MFDKTAVRYRLLAQRQALDAAERARRDTALGAGLKAVLQAALQAELQAELPAEAPALSGATVRRTLGIYWPIRSEPDLRTTYADLRDNGWQLALPAVVQRDAPLEFFAWEPGDALSRDACGVAAPVQRNQPLQPQVLLIPCVGFDAQGFRLGYGAGYYDRTLAKAPRPRTIGVAYADQLAEFASGPHDIPLDLILTEAGHFAPPP